MKYIKKYEIKKVNPNFSKLQMEKKFIDAAKRGSNIMVKKFIDQGVNVNARDDDNYCTALIHAVLGHFIMVVNTLINAGADVNLKGDHGETALMVAKTQKIIDKLLNAGADVNIVNNDGSSVIMVYLYYYQFDIIIMLEKFLEKGLDLDIKDNDDNNFYDLLKDFEKTAVNRQKYYQNIIKYMDEKFPQYREEWEFKQNVNKYNL